MIAGVQDTLDDRLVARPTIKSMDELKENASAFSALDRLRTSGYSAYSPVMG